MMEVKEINPEILPKKIIIVKIIISTP